ncbi:MAG: hypothetical protein IPL23_26560 [Saprospiraceae bacterium]|nr:hypothetical protein [Saprospiraceae bacterium]
MKNIFCKFFLFSFFLFMFSFGLKAQESVVIDSVSQALFAKYLFDQGLYKFAAEEYERLHYYYPNNKKYTLALFKADRFAGNIDHMQARLQLLPDQDKQLSRQYFLSLITNDQLPLAQQLLDNGLRDYGKISDDYFKFKVGLLVMEGSHKAAQDTMEKYKIDDSALANLIVMGSESKRKSKTLAGLMSAIVPSSGRFYARDYKDAIFSLVFMGGTAFQSYKRFNKGGINSAGGWIYGGISFGFYLGNIWGSVKAADRYNQKNYKKVYDETKNYFSTRFLD